MKKWITPILFSTLVVGCAETQTVSFDVPQENQIAMNLADVSWTSVEVPSKIQFQIDKSNQLLLNAQSVGPVASFTLPGNKGSLDIILESFVDGDTSFYAPNIIILNKKYEVIYQRSFEDFEYIPARLLDNDKFILEFTVIPDMAGEELKLLVYTSANDLKGTTPILHPAKAFAMAKNSVPPEIPDPLAKHVVYGSFRLTVDSNEVVNKRIIETTDNVPAGAELENFYKKAIRKAVENEDIPKALALLEEAKELNVKGTQETFIDALYRKK